jgi:hypothetical protein
MTKAKTTRYKATRIINQQFNVGIWLAAINNLYIYLLDEIFHH